MNAKIGGSIKWAGDCVDWDDITLYPDMAE